MLLGPSVAVSTANRVAGLEVNRSGILDLQGEPILILESLIEEFEKLTPEVTKYLVVREMEDFPELKSEFNRQFSAPRLRCPLVENHS